MERTATLEPQMSVKDYGWDSYELLDNYSMYNASWSTSSDVQKCISFFPTTNRVLKRENSETG
eukprot:10383483-Lingulodinium_polyedra.AAC.1